MRFNNYKRKYTLAGILLLFVFFTGAISAQDKSAKTGRIISVNMKVTDDNGAPVPNANVIVGEGVIHSETDENGILSFRGYPNDFVSISAPGYERRVLLLQEIINNSTISIKKTKLFMTSDDDVYLPLSKQKRRFLTGSNNVISSNQLEKYPSTDIRNAFTGLVPGLHITEHDGSPGFSAEERLGTFGITEKVGVSARGRNMIYIVNDIPVDITEMALDPQEIESVTVIKDIFEKAMYGPIGADGIILIKTKRGRTNERVMTVNAESGISVIDRFPEWTTGVDYAALNNSARGNDGLEPLYSAADITAYGKEDPYDLYHPNVNFRKLMLKNSRSFNRANISSSGGSEAVQYSAYLGYNGEGDIYKIGSTADYNRITANSNIDIKITEDLKVQFDIMAGLTIRRSPNFGYATGEGSLLTDLVEFNSAIPLINETPPNAFAVYANNDPSLKFPWFGVSSVYNINPVGNLLGNGYYTETGRKGYARISLDYDFSKLIKGLESQTFLSFDGLNLMRIGQAEDYFAYIATPSETTTGNDTILFDKVRDGVFTSDQSNLHDYYYQQFQFFEKLSYQSSFGIHDLQSSLTYLLYKVSRNGIEEPNREQNVVWTLKYSNNDKYIIQGLLNYAGTYSFSESERSKLFPSIGAAWIVSEENFMSNLHFVDFLKLRAEAGVLGFEDFLSPFLFRDRWTTTTGTAFGPHSANRWFGTSNETIVNIAYPSRIGYPDLTWEKRKEFSFGIDALMLNQKLALEVNYYNNKRDGIISQLSNTISSVTGVPAGALPRYNSNIIRYSGIEAGIKFSDNINKFRYSFGGNATIHNSEYLKFNEPDYRFEYQFTTGKPVDAYWGQTCLGKFLNDAETMTVPQLFDAVLKAGDLKYKDLNDDGFIDDNDMSVIGHTTPRLYFSLNADLNYANFELTVIGTGTAFYDLPLTNPYYWNGWLDDNYSNFVRDNVGVAYPRLTYYKVNNNFVNSDFWLTKGGYFKIQNIELAYNIPPDKLQVIRSRGIRLFLRGANMLTLSKVQDVDPESINSGVTTYPLYKTFTGGIKLIF